MRILIADDQVDVRKGLELVLGLEQDIQIVGTATNGLEAVEMAKLLNPDLILMDWAMPYLDGLEATRRIRDNNLSARIILLVTQSDAECKHLAETAGAFDIIEKAAPDNKITEVVRAATSTQPQVSTGDA